MACDLTTGRGSVEDCLEEQAGVKTVFFFRHSLLSITKNLAGEITDFGTGALYRFEQDERHGLALQEIVRNEDTQYVRQQIDLTLFYLKPEFMYTVNHLKQGLWAIFYMDYNDRIRLLGEFTPAYQISGIDQSGKAAGDNLWSNLSFEAISSAYAPFLEQFSVYPFDNFPNVYTIPRYDQLPGLITYNNSGEFVEVDNVNNKLDYTG